MPRAGAGRERDLGGGLEKRGAVRTASRGCRPEFELPLAPPGLHTAQLVDGPHVIVDELRDDGTGTVLQEVRVAVVPIRAMRRSAPDSPPWERWG
jgi:hypothetical protein